MFEIKEVLRKRKTRLFVIKEELQRRQLINN